MATTPPRKTKTNKKAKKRPLSARNADKFALYEQSVQDPDVDIHFIRRVFKKERGREPLSLREDFCGTAKLCAHWVRRRPERTAFGLDLDQPTLDYGMRTHIEPLGKDAERVRLLQRDVLEGLGSPTDVAVGFNFSYCIFRERAQMLRYFRTAYRDLAKDGAFFLDLHGGPEAQIETLEKTRQRGFTYVWEQEPIDAITATGVRHIHFEFPDRTKLKRAFSYDWRVWTLPEMRDLLAEAGFSRSDVFWEGTDGDGEGNGIFRRVRRAENEESWIAYLVAWR